MIDLTRLLSEIGDDKAFVLSDGTRIRSLKALSDKLRAIDDNLFKSYVNESKNDFASWISHCFEDELLSKRVSELKTKTDIAEEIETRLLQANVSQNSNTPPIQLDISNRAVDDKLPVENKPDANLKLDTGLNLDVDLNAGLDLDINLEADLTKASSPQPENKIIDVSPSLDLDIGLDSSLDTPHQTKIDQESQKPDISPSQSPISPTIQLSKPEIEPLKEIKENITPSPQKIEPLDTSQLQKLSQTQIDSLSVDNLQNDAKPAETSAPETKPTETSTPETKPGEIGPVETKMDDNLPLDKPKIHILGETMLFEPIGNKDITNIVDVSTESIIAVKEPKVDEPKIITQDMGFQKPIGSSSLKNDVPLATNDIKSRVKSLFDRLRSERLKSSSNMISSYKSVPTTGSEKTQLPTNPVEEPLTEKKDLKALFHKLKQQKDKGNTTEGAIEAKPEIKPEAQLSSTAPIQLKPADRPADLLNISDNDFFNLIGVNLQDEFIAAVSTEDQIKKKEKKYLKTGVPGFDDLVDKGIPGGTSILLSGGPGSGKTTFAIQQLGWAADHGEKCLFISLEEKEERLIEHMKEYGLNPEKYLRNGNLKIKKLDSFKLSRSVEALLAKARGELMIDIDPVMDIIPDGYQPERIVVDSLSSIAAAFAGQPEVYRIYVEQLFNIFEKLGVTSFIITEIQGSETTGHGGVEDFLADGVINFYNMKKGTLRQPAVEVFKMRGVRHKKKIVPFTFISGKGIEVYPLEEVFHGD